MNEGFDPTFQPSGTGHRAGSVPDPGGTQGATRYLREDQTWSVPGAPSVPYTPPGVASDQIACNIAGYLTNVVIYGSVKSILDRAIDTDWIIGAIDALLIAIPGIDFTIPEIDAAVGVLFGAISSGILSNFGAALADEVFWKTMGCRIYEGIRNLSIYSADAISAISNAILGITFTHGDVLTALAQFIVNLGPTGLARLTAAGSLVPYDCSQCGMAGTGQQGGPAGASGGPPVQAKNIGIQAGARVCTVPGGFTSSLTPVTFPTAYSVPPLCVASGAGEAPYTIVATHDVGKTGMNIACSIAYPRPDDDSLVVTWICVPGDGSAGWGFPSPGDQSVGGAATTATNVSGSIRGSASTQEGG